MIRLNCEVREACRWIFLTAWCCAATIASAQSPSPPKSKTMKQLELWTLLDYLPTRTPFHKEKIEQALRIVLIQDEKITNEYFTALKGGPVILAGEIAIEAVSFRVSVMEPTEKWLLNLTVAGKCVARSDVLARYPRLEVTNAPRRRFPNEETSYSRKELWGKVSFGFAERNPDCLSSVLFSGPKW